METYEGETLLWRGHPSWKSMLVFYVKWTILSLLPLAVWVALDASGNGTSATPFALATVVALVLTYLLGWIRRTTTRYAVSDRRIHIRTGLVSRNERATHVDRVQNVNVHQGIVQRLLGIGDVEWDTAGTDMAEADFTFRGIEDPSTLVRAVDRFYGEPLRELGPERAERPAAGT